MFDRRFAPRKRDESEVREKEGREDYGAAGGSQRAAGVLVQTDAK